MATDYSLGDIAAVTERGGFGGNGFGDGGWWILLLFIILGGNRGWGNGFGGNVGGNELYPWLNQSEQISQGFQTQNNTIALSALTSDVCNGFAGVNQAITSGFAGLEASNNARQIADLQQMFSLSQQFANCCCENRLATANLNSTILAENCADRAALNDGVRDLLVNQNNNTQRILDQLCQDKIDAKNDEIAQLRQQVNNLNLAASQGAQTARILADNAAQTVALEQYLNPTPIPAYQVANPNCCQQTCGCGSF